MSLTRTALACALLLAPSFAAAQQIDDAARAEAEQYMREGVAAARGTHWEEAYVAFRQAYERVPSNRVLMNLAGAQRQTGRWADAVHSYRRWLSDATDADEPYRAGMEQALSETELDLGHATIQAPGAHSSDIVTVDDTPAERGVALDLDPGTHTVRLVRGATVLRSADIVVTAGESQTLTLPPGPSETAWAAATPNHEATGDGENADGETGPWHTRPREHHRADVWSTPWPWVGIGAGVVVIGVIIAVAVAASSSGPPIPDMGNLGTFTL